jgi:hypothetical protein
MSNHIDQLSQALESAERSLRKVKALHVNTAETKSNVRELVRSYFEQARPTMLAALSGEGEMTLFDGAMQELLRCTQRRTRVEDYRRSLAASKRALSEIELRSLGSLGGSTPNTSFEPRQARILENLRKVNAAAADSYEQGLLDLRGGNRKSWRGTAVEFREALRELLDTLAPDAEVTGQPGFKLEPDAKGPTMKQKAMFILRARRPKGPQAKTFGDAVEVIEESIGKFVRSVYTHSSVGVHVASSKDEVRSIRDYVTLVLGELLEVTD